MKKIITLINSINYLLLKNKLIQPNQRFLICISGGQDSSSILFIFFILEKQWNIKILLIYCNHLWKEESLYTFLHLSKISFTLQLNLSYTLSLKGKNSEQEARNWRLKNYLRLVNFLYCNIILTGHTQSDHIETFIFNLCRGTGLTGTSSLKLKKNLTQYKKSDFLISNEDFQKLKKKQSVLILLSLKELKRKKTDPINLQKKFIKNKGKIDFIQKNFFSVKNTHFEKIKFFRPFLKKSRPHIKKICNNWKVPVFPDKTNQENSYTRNRIRKQLLPSLRFFFNPKIDSILFRYNKILLSEEKIIEDLVKKVTKEILSEHEKIFCINLPFFYSFPLAIQRKFCFLFFQNKLLIKSNFYTINLFISLVNEKFIELKKYQKNNQLEIYCNWFFFPEIGIIFFYKTIIILIK